MIWKRISNLWRLSAFEPRVLGSEPAPKETITATLIKKPAQFLPFKKLKPIEEINQ